MKNTLLLKYLIISLISIVYMSILCPISISANESFKNIGIQNGLAHTDANCVAQDSTGLIWIGTNSGLQNLTVTNFKRLTIIRLIRKYMSLTTVSLH